MPAPELSHLCDLAIELSPPLELGDAPRGRRRIIPITGGRVSGERLSGRILPGGSDWQVVYADGLAFLEARYPMETDDGALIDVVNVGYRHGPPEVIAALARGEVVDPASYYMRTQPRFETGDPRYLWLNRIVAVGTGRRDPSAVHLSFYEVL
ncbi:hypothetical protein CLD20_09785 [Afifella sp. IM 167]|nr:hypothetical protein [Afifella sp. IM 167]